MNIFASSGYSSRSRNGYVNKHIIISTETSTMTRNLQKVNTDCIIFYSLRSKNTKTEPNIVVIVK